MPNKRKVIINGDVSDNIWATVNPGEAQANQANTLLHLDDYLTEQSRNQNLGVWLKNDVDLESIAEQILAAPVIAIEFPVFMDGRGFSLARLLRERYHYQGEIRAIGHVIRDQLCYLKRCGFNAFELEDDVDLHAALSSLNDFSEAYQTSVDLPQPLFRRKA